MRPGRRGAVWAWVGERQKVAVLTQRRSACQTGAIYSRVSGIKKARRQGLVSILRRRTPRGGVSGSRRAYLAPVLSPRPKALVSACSFRRRVLFEGWRGD